MDRPSPLACIFRKTFVFGGRASVTRLAQLDLMYVTAAKPVTTAHEMSAFPPLPEKGRF